MIVNEQYKLVALHKCQYICKVKATKILKCIKTLFTVKTYIYNVIYIQCFAVNDLYTYIYILYIYTYIYTFN